MNYVGFNKYDTANGEGIRVSLFVAGCNIHCKDCFNKESWDFNAGKRFTSETKHEILDALDKDYIDGFSLLGGEPFDSAHEETLLDLLETIKKRFPKKSIYAWTGYNYNQVKHSPLTKYVDVLIDGSFIKRLHDKTLSLRGSSNQKVHYLCHK